MRIKNDKTNGCGAKGSIIKPPYKKFFKASCNRHDIGYCIGGDEVDRMRYDADFLKFMLLDTLRIKKGFKRGYYQLWVIIYFLAVRIFGKKYFNYKKAFNNKNPNTQPDRANIKIGYEKTNKEKTML